MPFLSRIFLNTIAQILVVWALLCLVMVTHVLLYETFQDVFISSVDDLFYFLDQKKPLAETRPNNLTRDCSRQKLKNSVP